jgi:hypothetical protein
MSVVTTNPSITAASSPAAPIRSASRPNALRSSMHGVRGGRIKSHDERRRESVG